MPWELADSITARQFAWLRAYAKVEPFGFEVENFRSAIIAQTIARVNGVKTTKVSDYYPTIRKPVEHVEQTQSEQMAILSAAGSATKD